MLGEGIIKESISPWTWMVPAVFMKKSGEICLCVDYRELNKRTTKDAYPLPIPDEVKEDWQAQLSFLYLTYRVGSGRCLYILRIKRRLHSAQDRE